MIKGNEIKLNNTVLVLRDNVYKITRNGKEIITEFTPLKLKSARRYDN